MAENGNKKMNQIAVKRSNNVMGLVYVGAAILIFVVGLRGLGTAASQISFIPEFLLDAHGKISVDYVIMALIVEFVMLLILSIVTFFTPADEVKASEKDGAIISKNGNLKAELDELKKYTEEEMNVINDYVDKFESLSKRLNKIHMINLQAVNHMKESVKVKESVSE